LFNKPLGVLFEYELVNQQYVAFQRLSGAPFTITVNAVVTTGVVPPPTMNLFLQAFYNYIDDAGVAREYE